jgi:hypothetical protein
MRENFVTLEAEEKIKQCEIAAIPMCNIDWYNSLVDRYRSSLDKPEEVAIEKDPNNEAARQFLFGVIAHQRGQ